MSIHDFLETFYLPLHGILQKVVWDWQVADLIEKLGIDFFRKNRYSVFFIVPYS